MQVKEMRRPDVSPQCRPPSARHPNHCAVACFDEHHPHRGWPLLGGQV